MAPKNWTHLVNLSPKTRILRLISVMAALLMERDDVKLNVYHAGAYDLAQELDRLRVPCDAD